MRLKLLDWVCCPECKGVLSLEGSGGKISEPIEEGTLKCGSCAVTYPIRDGIPRLLPAAEATGDVASTRDAFAWEWSRYPGSLPEDKGIFLEESQLPPDHFKGKLTLDAGCGMGRYSRVARSLGAEVIAFDLSLSLDRLIEDVRGDESFHAVQGDALKPPFRPGIFDHAYSHGVLHHTSDTEAAFKQVSALVKPGGTLSVWLYGRAGKSSLK